jgi:hypothetical protein
VALAVFVLAATALAGELQPSPPIKPTVKGDRSRVVLSERIAQRLERTQDGVPPQAMDSSETTEATWSQEVVEVRAARPARVRVTIERWERTSGARTERLAGPRVVRVKPLERTWELEVAEPALSGAARRFLDRLTERLAGAGSIAAVQSLVLPASPVPVNGTWPVAPAALEPVLLGAPYVDLDPRATRVTARVMTLEPRAQVVLEGTAQLVNVAGTQDRFTQGGVCALRVDATWAPGQRPGVGGTVTVRQTVEGAAAGQHPDGTPYRTKVALEYELTTVEGPVP